MSNSLDNRNVIRDGQELPGYVKGEPGIHGSCRFSYRPMLSVEVEEVEHAREVNFDKPKVAAERIQKAIAEHLVAWEETDDQGTPVPVSLEAVTHLRYMLTARLYRIIAGLAASDKDPASESELVGLQETLGNS